MVELLMKRKAAISASLLDLPPARDKLRYFWSGLDLKNIQKGKYWPDRIAGANITFYLAVQNANFPIWYSMENNRLLLTGPQNQYMDLEPEWKFGSTGAYTIEIVIDFDWERAKGGDIVGQEGVSSGGSFRLSADAVNGMGFFHMGYGYKYTSGPLADGVHVLSMIATRSGSRTTFDFYIDGVFGQTLSLSGTFSTVDVTLLRAPLCAMTVYGKGLTQDEITRNYRYYKSIWR